MEGNGRYIVELTKDYHLDEVFVSDIEESHNTIWFDTEMYGEIRINAEYVNGIYESKNQLERIRRQ